MTVALAFEVDDGSRVMQTQIEIQESDGNRSKSVTFEAFYCIDYTAQLIRSKGFRTIALQFPDSLLPEAFQVQDQLKLLLEGQVDRVFLLGDTSYGSCCVDEVAAQHLQADCIVHYGRSCLSPTSVLPVIYVFGNAPIDLEHCATAFTGQLEEIDATKQIVLLFEPSYYHIAKPLHSLLTTRFPERSILYGTMPTFFNPKESTIDTQQQQQQEIAQTISVGGQIVDLPCDACSHDQDGLKSEGLNVETTVFLYVGAETPHLTSILMRYNTVECCSYDPVNQTIRLEGARINKALMRRFFLVQQAKEAQIIGILMGTLGVSRYLDVVRNLQALIKRSGRKSYLFVVGKINVPKLANYAEIDAFVLVACEQNSLMDSKEFYKPIVTPFELQLALSEDDNEWTGKYLTNFQEVLPCIEKTSAQLEEGNKDRGDEEDADRPYFSLVTGTYQTCAGASHNHSVLAEGQHHDENSGSEEDKTSTALQVRNAHHELVAFKSEAGEFLATREYQGLDPRIGKTEAHAAILGRVGIARGYTNEPINTEMQ